MHVSVNQLSWRTATTEVDVGYLGFHRSLVVYHGDMVLLKTVIKTEVPTEKQSLFPFSTPIISGFSELRFTKDVTFFVGENGSGKSTLLEGIAAACHLPIVGSTNIDQDQTLKYATELATYLKLGWLIKRNIGFFLRAEDFFGFTKQLNRMKAELQAEIERFDRELPDGYGKKLTIGSLIGQIEDMEQRYGVDLDAGSHGESFIKLFSSRIRPGGLYLLDEPETPLSPTRQMGLLRLIYDAVKKGSQFVIATHSPILMAYPDAQILNFNLSPIKAINYDEIEHVQTLKGFLLNKEQYLKYLLEK